MNSTTHAASRRGGDVFLCSPNNQFVEEKVCERKASLVALCVGNQFVMKNEQELCSERFRKQGDDKCNACMESSKSILEEI